MIAAPQPLAQSLVPDELRQQIASALPAADVVSVEDRFAVIEQGSLRARLLVPFGDHVDSDSLKALGFLIALSSAGVDLQSTGRSLSTPDGTLRCELVYDEDDGESVRCAQDAIAEAEPEAAMLDAPYWLLPPSRRSRQGHSALPPSAVAAAPQPLPPRVDTPATARIGRVLIDEPYMQLRGTILSSALRLITVTESDAGPPQGSLLCLVNRRGPLRVECASTAFQPSPGLVSEIDGTLLIVGRGYDDHRAGTWDLGALTITEGGLVVDTLLVGSSDGYGGACESHDSYCVEVVASAYSLSLLESGCIQRRPLARWRATHVRAPDLWLDEVVQPTPNCLEHFQIVDGQFSRSECGATSLPACRTEEQDASEE